MDKKEFKKLCLKIRQCEKYKDWRQRVLDRDKEPLKDLQVHHKIPFREILLKNNITMLAEAEECKELWDIRKGITITRGEHRILSLMERYKYHTEGFFKAIESLIKDKKNNRKVYKG